ncbi:hypothetical protein [Virgibacillus kimchii]
MGTPLLLIFITIFSLSLLIIYKNFFYRDKITKMVGMMVAMLGNMIEIEYQNSIVIIMFLLFLSTLLLLLYIIQKEVNKNKLIFYTSPLFIAVLFGLLFIVFNQMGPIFTYEESPNHNQIEDHH